MNEQIKAGAEIHSGDGGYSIGTQEKYEEFVKNRNRSMNSRIKELVIQLGPNPVATIGNWGRVEWANNVYPQLGDKMYASIDLEKFAELIVRECIDTVSDCSMEYCTRPQIVSEIKEHFGVEE